MTDTLTIPLSKLTLWSGNVRKTGAREGIAELAASIAAHGLIQPLLVRKANRGYEIVAGQRRFHALKSLAKAGKIAKNCAVACTLAIDTVEAAELSLAENVVRAPMHPADQFEAFRKLIDDGASVADVATRFGVNEGLVMKRMKLGRLSPVILAAYREGEIGLEEAQAFALVDDHDAQERVLAELSSWRLNAQSIRRALTEGEVPTSDKRMRFIGAEAYQAAGGIIRRDLFSDDDTAYAQDAALLEALVTQKLADIAKTVGGEGWKWIEVMSDIDYAAFSSQHRFYPEREDLPKEAQAELDALAAEYDGLVDSDDDADADRLAEIEGRMDALESTSATWPARTLAVAGAVISLSYDGEVRIERGLVRKEDAKLAVQLARCESEDEPAPKPEFSSSLIESLTAHKSTALAATLATNADVALAAVVHALLLRAFYPGHREDSCLKLSLGGAVLSKSITPESCKGLSALHAAIKALRGRLPSDANELAQWCLRQPQSDLLAILAILAGASVDAMQRKADRADCGRLKNADELANAVALDMTGWFAPTAENYFSRVSRAQILAAIDEAKGGHAPALEKLKKATLAKRAEDLLSGTGWLPATLVTAHDDDVADEGQPLAQAAE
jgi:ParB family chromosome partitioning protein